MKMSELKDWLIEEIVDAQSMIDDLDQKNNSYDRGHALGWRQALERVRLKINNELDE